MSILTLENFGFPVVQLLVVGAYIALELRRAVRSHFRAATGPPRRPRVPGGRLGAWGRLVVMAALGAGVLLGSPVALAGFSIGLVMAGLPPAWQFADGLLTGVRKAGARRSPVLQAVIATVYLVITRGILIGLLYAAHR